MNVKGLRLSTAASGMRYQGRDDLTLIELAESAKVAGVFTQNAFCAAPVVIAKKHIASEVRYLLINAGNANAGTGQEGLDNALQSCQQVADFFAVNVEQVLPFSTGVIGQNISVSHITDCFPTLKESLSDSAWEAASKAIMTTDTVPKLVSRQCDIRGETITVTGMSKGGGMICPNMATMLGYVVTDARVSQQWLQASLEESVANSFNSITVDGDTSTNDACLLIATNQAGPDDLSLDELIDLFETLQAVFTELAQKIVGDAEGATKFITLDVSDAGSEDEARVVAYKIAHSPLVKTAFYASDANWGRILAAIGNAGLEALDISTINLSINDVNVIINGEPASDYTEERGQAAMAPTDIDVKISLGRGDESAIIWTSDLSHDYVSINADYRS